MSHDLLVLAAFAAAFALLGYSIGRYQPLHRTSTWANWQMYDQSMRCHSLRWWAVFVVLSVENLGQLVAHPRQGWHAWRHRNDPPPARGPALTFRTRNHDQEA